MREIRRNKARKLVGNRKLKAYWEIIQKERYGEDYFDVCIKEQKRKSRGLN